MTLPVIILTQGTCTHTFIEDLVKLSEGLLPLLVLDVGGLLCQSKGKQQDSDTGNRHKSMSTPVDKHQTSCLQLQPLKKQCKKFNTGLKLDFIQRLCP